MQRLFMNNNHIIYTEKVSDAEYEKKILFCNPSESLVPYYDEIAGKVFAEHFDVVKCPNKHIWYGEWNNHRRMVIKLHMFYSYEVRFGYNYDFIPILNNQNKFVYHRTGKSVDLDVMDLYYNHISYIPDNMTHWESYNVRRKYELPASAGAKELDFAKEYIEDVIRTNITFMKEFYEAYKSDEDIIRFLDHTIQKGNIFQKYRYIWAKAFLYAKLQDMNKAIMTMGDYYEHRNSEIPPMVIEKLEAVKEMFE